MATEDEVEDLRRTIYELKGKLRLLERENARLRKALQVIHLDPDHVIRLGDEGVATREPDTDDR